MAAACSLLGNAFERHKGVRLLRGWVCLDGCGGVQRVSLHAAQMDQEWGVGRLRQWGVVVGIVLEQGVWWQVLAICCLPLGGGLEAESSIEICESVMAVCLNQDWAGEAPRVEADVRWPLCLVLVCLQYVVLLREQ